MMQYTVLYFLGIAIGVFGGNTTAHTLQVLEPLSLTALVASFLVSFAGFARTESWYKAMVQYGVVPLFGAYTVVIATNNNNAFVMVLQMTLLVGVMSGHFGYWMSSVQSRAFRLQQFNMSFGQELPHTRKLIAYLNVSGESHISDEIIRSIVNGRFQEAYETMHRLTGGLWKLAAQKEIRDMTPKDQLPPDHGPT